MLSITRYQRITHLHRRIETPPHSDLALICVIPCMNEPDMVATLAHLQSRDMPVQQAIEIIVLVNHSQHASPACRQQNARTCQMIADYVVDWPVNFRCYVIHAFDLPYKKSGVGVARKMGMDEAMLRLADVNHADGLIVSLDADCQVDADYFTALLAYAAKYPKQHAMLCDFQHPVSSIEDADHRHAMVSYELLLRTIALGWSYARLPYAFIAIGSCMIVRANAYARHHGMNSRQAGEDFYFMHKLARERPISILHHIKVYPSARISTRTPFGTGQAVRQMCEGDSSHCIMADPQVFVILRQMSCSLDALFNEGDSSRWLATLAPELAEHLAEQGFATAFLHMHGNTASVATFRKQFFTWFDGLKAWRFVHKYRELHSLPISKSASALLNIVGYTGIIDDNTALLLATIQHINLPFVIEKV
ncbi:MAG: glycosyltransferase family 2 protein [Mariprofundaceae bacterium]|nr:glycosyltransferase family 2 protein [Mariprofundaceae bacterium]